MGLNLSTVSKEWALFEHLFRQRHVPAREILLREGAISKMAFYIEKGSLRLWFNNNGADVTFQFFFEGEGVSSVESFRNRQPSLFTIQTIEPCIIHSISRKDFQYILDHSPIIRESVEEHSFQRLIHYQKLFLSRIKDSPEKRYKELLKEHPEIVQRVPQHYIASYLGITAVSLSRIRNRR
ncbi:cyclic nucleotide-binding protein [Niabella ginsenosidivorans]|uniref:Cyclic nucleotide-binding protein n=1 Tax=Niabella ginsenosidivorans TaxID=1176587 RepID=A0A1A9HZP5_9BACT|nr:Crp/Fnr family transcriptional regulator [Niabella ginsenosidivorans]ANH79892.1 cyclic nucleotide-binding protein [Niabella ginsenosidivorans]